MAQFMEPHNETNIGQTEINNLRERTTERLTDPKRLNILRMLDLLDNEAVDALDRMTKLASKIIDAPISLVSLLDVDKQIFKGMTGLKEPLATERTTPLSHSFCQYVVGTDEPLIVSDARQHPILKDNLAITELDVIAYLGMPLRIHQGPTLGSFCVIDTKPRDWTTEEVEIIRELSELVITELELRAALVEQRRAGQDQVKLQLEIERREMVDVFVRDFNHEFRTALASINSRTYMLYRSDNATDRNHYRQLVEQSTEAITNLLDSMMILTRIDKLDTDALRAKTHLHTCMEHIMDKVADIIQSKHITINLPDLTALPAIQGNQQHITIVLEQLMKNAIAFSHPGNTIDVTQTVQDKVVHLDITNYGDSIPAEAQESIFQLFYRQDEARTERGLGLGLPIAKRILKRYYGDLTLLKSDEAGTTFRINFVRASED